MQILPGSTIGILGDNTTNAPLIYYAHKMGLNIALFTEIKYENYRTEADYWFMEDKQWEDFVGISTIIIYNQNWLSFRMMNKLDNTNLPQGITLLELTSDATLLRGLFEENAINILPYQLASTLDDVSLAANSLTYPVCVKSIFKDSQNQEIILNGSWDLGLVAPLIDGGQLLVETYIVDKKIISLPVVIDYNGKYVSYPLLETVMYQDIKQKTLGIELDNEIEKALYDAADKIINNIKYVGALTINFLVTAKNNLYVQDILIGIYPGQLLSEVSENPDIALQMFRAVTGQALMPVQKNTKYKILSRSLTTKSLSRLYMQWDIHENWILNIYENSNTKGNIGEVVIIGDDWNKLQTQLAVSGIWENNLKINNENI